MEESFLEQMIRHITFGEVDAANLRALGAELTPTFDALADRFCRRLAGDAPAASAKRATPAETAEFKPNLQHWLETVFSGPHDSAHFAQASEIGRSHVRVGLCKQNLVAAMNVLRTEATDAVYRVKPSSLAQAVHSVNRILDIELAIVLRACDEEHAQRVRRDERKRMEQRLEEVSHLANVGELAASLAHEIKNPLAGISGAIQVIRTAFEPDDPRREIIAEILSQIDRLDRTVRDLLVYARPQPSVRVPKNVGTVIRRSLKFLRQEPTLRNVRVRWHGLDSGVITPLDEAQIEQVITNLILNAAHACEQGGDVSVVLSAEREVVDIDIIDTGQGMTGESVKRAFEPFFTTKARGTGLGLTICKRIVEAHGGRITIQSVEGKGTRVRIELQR